MVMDLGWGHIVLPLPPSLPHSLGDAETWEVAVPRGAGEICPISVWFPLGQLSPQAPSWAVPRGDPYMQSCWNQEISLVAFRPHHWSVCKHPHDPSYGFRDVTVDLV